MPGDWFKVSQSDIGFQSKTVRLQGLLSRFSRARISPTQPSELNLAPQHTFTGSRSLGTPTTEPPALEPLLLLSLNY